MIDSASWTGLTLTEKPDRLMAEAFEAMGAFEHECKDWKLIQPQQGCGIVYAVSGRRMDPPDAPFRDTFERHPISGKNDADAMKRAELFVRYRAFRAVAERLRDRQSIRGRLRRLLRGDDD